MLSLMDWMTFLPNISSTMLVILWAFLWVYSAILAVEGKFPVFNYKSGPTYRVMLPTPPPLEEVPTCAEEGVLGVLPG
jgi:molybdopterin/thiamine biosynthesis adenylyltransferase